jgi:hypothetical protein
MKLIECHIEDLRRSGLSDETIHSSGIRSIPKPEARELLGFDPGCGGMAIPYPGTEFARFKPDVVYKFQSGRTAKYLQAKGSVNRLYIPSRYSADELGDPSRPVIVTEGEKKALKGAQDLDGYLVVGLPGVWSFRRSGSIELLDDFDLLTLDRREAFIVFDSDSAKNDSVQKAERSLAAALRRRNADVYVCRIPG